MEQHGSFSQVGYENGVADLYFVGNKTMAGKLRSNKGQALIEFAFVLPFMVIIVLGIIEFGVLFYNQAMITNASREGARVGMLDRETAGSYWPEAEMQTTVQQAVNDYLQGRILAFGPLGTIATTATRSGIINADGVAYSDYASGSIGTVRVRVVYQHTYLTIPDFFGWANTINIAAESTMRLE